MAWSGGPGCRTSLDAPGCPSRDPPGVIGKRVLAAVNDRKHG